MLHFPVTVALAFVPGGSITLLDYGQRRNGGARYGLTGPAYVPAQFHELPEARRVFAQWVREVG